jgi:molybdopterin converting factor small subunit
VTLPAGATLRELIAEIWRRYPKLETMAHPAGGGLASMIRWLVNSRTVKEEAELVEGDEILLLPGASGG